MDVLKVAQGLIDHLASEAQKAEALAHQHILRAEGVKMLYEALETEWKKQQVATPPVHEASSGDQAV
jgi:hypothetical protein